MHHFFSPHLQQIFPSRHPHVFFGVTLFLLETAFPLFLELVSLLADVWLIFSSLSSKILTFFSFIFLTSSPSSNVFCSKNLNGFFQIKILPEALALTMYLPSGLKRTADTMAEWPNPMCVVLPKKQKFPYCSPISQCQVTSSNYLHVLTFLVFP